jgi:hypothetical protein
MDGAALYAEIKRLRAGTVALLVTAHPASPRAEAAVAVGQEHDAPARRAAGDAGGQGAQPALALLVGGALAVAAAALAELRRVAHPGELVEQAQRQAGGGAGQGGMQEQAALAEAARVPRPRACGWRL